MNKFFSIVLIFFIVLFSGVPQVVFTQGTSEEHIERFDVALLVNRDNTLNVIERIIYNFGSNSRHGIFRDLPYSYNARGGKYNLTYSNFSVTQDGIQGSSFAQSKSGGMYHLKIGDANKTISGTHEYVIRYVVSGAVNFFEDHDEIYWNTTGNGWQVPIYSASTTVAVEGGVPTKQECFTGVVGSTEKNCTASLEQNGAVFKASAILPAGEGLTTVTAFPKGLVIPPTPQENVFAAVKSNGLVALPIPVFVILYWLWRKYGKDPDVGTIVAEYDSPNDMSPMQLSLLQGKSMFNGKNMAAQIIYLATRGVLKITRLEKKGWFGGEDFVLERLTSKTTLSGPDVLLVDTLFSGKERIELSEIKKDRTKGMSLLSLATQYKREFETLGYFKKRTRGVGGLMIVLAFPALFFSIVIAVILQSVYVGIGLALSALLLAIFGFIMPARTNEGAKVYARMLGLKEYIAVAEQDRIKFHDAPEKSPELFQKLLPFAIFFGLEKKWAEKFDGLDVQPGWYSDSSTVHAFSAASFSNSMSSFSSQASSSIVTASSGGSGFSGGGSGGGGGGGGGGSW